MNAIASVSPTQAGSSATADALISSGQRPDELVAGPAGATVASQVFSGITGESAAPPSDGAVSFTASTTGSLTPSPTTRDAQASARDYARRELHEVRNALLDERDAGTLDAFGAARLSDVDRELDALDALEIARARDSDSIWARLEDLAARVLASAPHRGPS